MPIRLSFSVALTAPTFVIAGTFCKLGWSHSIGDEREDSFAAKSHFSPLPFFCRSAPMATFHFFRTKSAAEGGASARGKLTKEQCCAPDCRPRFSKAWLLVIIIFRITLTDLPSWRFGAANSIVCLDKLRCVGKLTNAS